MTVKTASAPKAVPVATPTTRPYWEGTQAGELRLQRCADCGHHFLYPRVRCPKCGSADAPWVRASGRAKLYSYVINHMPAPGWEADGPYVIALVQLEEGPRMMSSLVGVPPDPAHLVLDMPLQVRFEARGTMMLPVFAPAGSAA